MTHVHRLLAAAAILLLGTTAALAQHRDMEIASTADGGGALAIEYDFDTIVAASYDATLTALLPPGFTAYSSTDPGFESLEADEPLESLYRLDAGTQVTMQVTALSDGVAAFLNGTLMDAVGESAVIGTEDGDEGLHHHAELRLVLMRGPDQPGEGTISFVLTTTSPSYAASETFTLRLSNATLLPGYDTAAFDKAAVKCSASQNKAVGKLTAKTYAILGKCMQKVAELVATEESGGATAGAAAKVAKACGDDGGAAGAGSTMLDKLARERAKAFAAIDKACGAAGAAQYDADAINRHLHQVACRVQELVALGNTEAHGVLAETTQGGTPVIDALPCLAPTQRTE